MKQDTWRLVHSAPADGATNMAIDEAILLAVTSGHSPPTLRFYAWEPPCLSLGVAQHHTEADTARLDALGWDIVRRPTGGKAILHTDELTYSAAAMKDDPRVAGGVIESYRRLSRGLIEGLQVLGLVSEADRQAAGAHKGQGPVCFEVPSHYEITVNGQKLIGSAQVRKQGGVLQHGTLPLVGDLGRICDALAFEDEAAREAAKVRVRERAITLEAALGRRVSWADVAEALAEGFARALEVDLAAGALSDAESAQAAEIREAKYGGLAWTRRR